METELTGAIPAALGKLSKLEILWLSNNQLSGGLPPELGNLSELTILYLYNNRLSGDIPQEFGKLTSLTTLDIRQQPVDRLRPHQLAGATDREEYRIGRAGILLGCIFTKRTCGTDCHGRRPD